MRASKSQRKLFRIDLPEAHGGYHALRKLIVKKEEEKEVLTPQFSQSRAPLDKTGPDRERCYLCYTTGSPIHQQQRKVCVMRERTIEKINAEMQKAPNDRFLEFIGHYIIDRCIDAPAAEKIAAAGKTLAGAVGAVRADAQKKAKNNVAAMSQIEVFDVVDIYFSLPASDAARAAAISAMMGGTAATATVPAPKAVSISLDDFL